MPRVTAACDNETAFGDLHMAICKVYFPTFRRPQLLVRAVNSLLHQNFDDWVCELHNDDPIDSFPGELIDRIGGLQAQAFGGPVAADAGDRITATSM